MHLNNSLKTLLCYGDSNTWGFVPKTAEELSKGIERYAKEIRWPGLLQTLLGDNYYVIEEGLNGRTTNLDYHIPPDRNGKKYLPPCLYSHAPIDLVILFLGGNDLKAYFNRTPSDICNGLDELVEIIKNSKYGSKLQESPKILIISQPIPLAIGEEYTDENGVRVFEMASQKAELLVKLYQNLAKMKNCHFLNIVNDIQLSSIDGLHLDKNGHKKLAHLIQVKILEIFSE